MEVDVNVKDSSDPSGECKCLGGSIYMIGQRLHHTHISIIHGNPSLVQQRFWFICPPSVIFRTHGKFTKRVFLDV